MRGGGGGREGRKEGESGRGERGRGDLHVCSVPALRYRD